MSKKKRQKKKSQKIKINKQLAQTGFEGQKPKQQGRGMQIVTLSRLREIMGENKQGGIETTTIDNPLYFLLPEERERIFRLVSPVFGVITSRMNRMAGTPWTITMDKKNEDREYEKIKMAKQMYDEYKTSDKLDELVSAAKLKMLVKSKLKTVRDDLSNFDAAAIRWRKLIQFESTDKSDEIKDYLMRPNAQDSWVDYIRKWVHSHHLHGAAAVYKQQVGDRVRNIYILPGGTVMPYRSEYMEDRAIYIQFSDRRDVQIFRPDEIAYAMYVPTTWQSGGYVPIETLINKVSETLLFDKLMAEQADGSRFPEKMIIVNDTSPFGDPNIENFTPIDKGEQKRIEEKFKTKIEGGVMTFSGNGATVVDLSKENTMEFQNQRQKDIRDETALVFNMSIQEVNLMGDKKFSSNDSSEQQSEMEQGKGLSPLKTQFENQMNVDILPYMVGGEYTFQFEVSKNDMEETKLLTSKIASGYYSVNELRKENNDMPFDGDEFNRPTGSGVLPTGTEVNPLNIRGL
jgi:phage portal protein BeeE